MYIDKYKVLENAISYPRLMSSINILHSREMGFCNVRAIINGVVLFTQFVMISIATLSLFVHKRFLVNK